MKTEYEKLKAEHEKLKHTYEIETRDLRYELNKIKTDDNAYLTQLKYENILLKQLYEAILKDTIRGVSVNARIIMAKLEDFYKQWY